MTSLFFTSLTLASLACHATPTSDATLPCHCEFYGPENDTPGCRAYGQLEDGELVPWHMASRACLDHFGVVDRTIDPYLLASMFPNPDGTGGSPSAFVDYLRSDNGVVASEIKANFPQFWVESTTQEGKMVFYDEIKVGNLTYVCSNQMGGNEGACWTAIRSYFSREPGETRLAGVGRHLYSQQAVSRENEQKLVRIRICSDGPPTDGECGELAVQVGQVKEEKTGMSCSAFGMGAEGNKYSRCAGESAETMGEGGNGSGSPTIPLVTPFIIAVIAVYFQGL